MLKHLAENSQIIENAIKEILSDERKCSSDTLLIDAEEYSLLAGGKRIRSTLCMEFYKLFGGTSDISKLAACLELAHTFSLIHDDMPEMDNDELRRGRPTCHIRFGCDTALLAGDGLAILPYKVISSEAQNGTVSYENAIRLISILSSATGNEGMISGQMVDLWGEKHTLSQSQVLKMYAKKTGALIKASCLFGAVLANADEQMLSDAAIYAENIGLAFQLVDDLLNISGTSEELGKPVGTDKERNKNTLVSIIGADNTKRMIEECNMKAAEAIERYSDSEFLADLISYLTTRTN